MSRALVTGFAYAACTLMAGCTGTEVGNPVADVRVSLTARSSDATVVLHDSGDAGVPVDGVAIEELWVSLGSVRFVLDDDCEAERDLRGVLEGPFVADLASAPSPLASDLPRGRYCSVRASLERAAASDAGAPEGLEGHSLLLRGHRADGVPFTIRTRDKPDFVLHGQNRGFSADDASNALFLAFDAATWLEGVDLQGAAPNAQGQVVIEPGTEMTRLTTFETNLRRSLALFKDGNGDGKLADDEAEDPIAQ